MAKQPVMPPVLAGSVIALMLVAGCTDPAEPEVQRTATALTTPTVTVGSINGTGCPAGTATTTVAPGGSSVTATYTAFTAKAGTGSVSGENRRACVISLQVTAPGQSRAITSVTNHGAISIPSGGTALQRTNYLLQGSSANHYVDHPATGPQSGAWDKTDPAPFTAGCGTTANLNLILELRTNAGASGAASSLSLNGSTPGTTINLGFTACP